MIRARGLEKRYGDKRVLRGVGFEVARDGFLLVTGPNGSGKTTLLRLCAGLAVPTAGELHVPFERGRIGYIGHEPLVYRELTALENLDLYGRLYRVAERRERTGMLLERFGLWDARHERADSYSRGMLQRLALCRALLHGPDLLVLDEPYSGLDEEGAALLDRELRGSAQQRRLRRRDTRSRAHRTSRLLEARTRMNYFADVGALARKDLLLELRARDTLPAMLLFVLSTLVIFHFVLPGDSSELAAKGLLWVAIVFTALLGLSRAFAAEREQGVIDGLVLAPSDRSAIWFGKALSVLAFLGLAELVALPAFGLFFGGVDGPMVAGIVLADVGIAAVGTLLAAMAAASRARELLLPLLFLPLAIPIVVGGVGASVTDDPSRYVGFLALYDALFAIICWASFEYVVTE